MLYSRTLLFIHPICHSLHLLKIWNASRILAQGPFQSSLYYSTFSICAAEVSIPVSSFNMLQSYLPCLSSISPQLNIITTRVIIVSVLFTAELSTHRTVPGKWQALDKYLSSALNTGFRYESREQSLWPIFSKDAGLQDRH